MTFREALEAKLTQEIQSIQLALDSSPNMPERIRSSLELEKAFAESKLMKAPKVEVLRSQRRGGVFCGSGKELLF